MEKFYQTESDPKQLSPLTLAYVGDGVYELFVREYIVSKGNCPVKKLHSRAVSFVRCEFQAKVFILLPLNCTMFPENLISTANINQV